jgi:tetratricopeptide (TPR) repeat protein
MKSVIGKVLLILILLTAHRVQAQQTDEMPVTSKSQEAVKLYHEGLQAYRDVHIGQAVEHFRAAVALDSTFFMPNYNLALMNLIFFKNQEEYQKYYQNAIATKDRLNQGERLIQKALTILAADTTVDVTDLGIQLVKLYPKSVTAHEILAEYQYFANDYEGMDRTLNAMLDLDSNPAHVYNWMGYNYMNMSQLDNAYSAFSKYMQLAPENPNSYDSMGDYLMAVKEYQKAYNHYMKAYKMDTLNFKMSHEKALKAQSVMND